MSDKRWLAPFINVGHFVDHLAMLIFPTVVIALARDWQRDYSELLPLTVGGFIAFGAFALPAGWLADHWSRYRMMVVFFFGLGVSLFLTGFAQTAWQIGLGLTVTGLFAAIYHPVGIAMLVAAPTKLGAALGWNGLYGNLGLAAAALISGALMDALGWRAAFFVPGVVSIAAGAAFLALVPDPGPVKKTAKSIGLHVDRATMTRIFTILLVATAFGGVIFNSTTVAMPKVFDERLRALTQTNFGIGALVAIVYGIAAFAQVAMGTLIDRFELRRLMIGVALAQIPLLAIAATLDGWPMLVAALAMMLAIFGQIPLNDAIVGKYVADEYRARVFSVRYVVSLGVAAVGVPLVALLHRTQGGFRNVFFTLAALAAGMLLASLFFPARPVRLAAATS
jgi:MFS family permease